MISGNRRGRKMVNRLALLMTVAGTISIAAAQSTFAGSLSVLSSGNMGSDSVRMMAGSANDNISYGWIQTGDIWQYQLSGDSIVCGGWIKDGDGWYYFDENGTMAADTTLTIGGHSYTFESSGAWRETAPADTLFVHFPAGQVRDGTYEQPGAGIRISLPEGAMISTAKELRNLSAQDYVPSYYDLLATVPGQGIIGTVIQYNSDPMEKILADDHDVFTNFRGMYDLKPSEPQPAVIAGYPFEKIGCHIFGIFDMDVYLRSEDNKVLYLFLIVPAGDREAAGKLLETVERMEQAT